MCNAKPESVDGNAKPENAAYTAIVPPKVHGMIDGNANHNSIATWPPPLTYVRIENAMEKGEAIHTIDRMAALAEMTVIRSAKNVNLSYLSTAEIGDYLVRRNTSLYNKDNVGPQYFDLIGELSDVMADIDDLLRRGSESLSVYEGKTLEDLNEYAKELRKKIADTSQNNVPSLVVASTMDMEFAHRAGYEGREIPFDDTSAFQAWKEQIANTETAVISNPLRLFPLFSYDPRRYRYFGKSREPRPHNHGIWSDPFSRIVGCKDSDSKNRKIWLGFCMNPQFGFRPFDELCEHLPHFYKKCMDDNIPILAHCAPEGVTTHEATFYRDFDNDNIRKRIKENEKRHDMLKKRLPTSPGDVHRSSRYRGIESVVRDADLNHFYMNYGHPRNWIPVLEYFPKLHLCLSGFGGNSEWQHKTMREWAKSDICKDKKCEECERKNVGRKCVYAEDAKLPTRQWIRCIIKLIGKYNDVYTDISGLNIYNDDVRSGLDKLLRMVHSGHEGCKHLRDKLIFGSDWYFTYLTDVSMGNSSVPHNYNNYCRKFKALFSEVDDTGKFWERVSLINPWSFYALSDGDDENKNRIKKMYTELTKLVKNNETQTTMLDDMYNKVFNGDGGLIKYVSGKKVSSSNNDDSVAETQRPNVKDDDKDLAPFIVQLEEGRFGGGLNVLIIVGFSKPKEDGNVFAIAARTLREEHLMVGDNVKIIFTSDYNTDSIKNAVWSNNQISTFGSFVKSQSELKSKIDAAFGVNGIDKFVYFGHSGKHIYVFKNGSIDHNFFWSLKFNKRAEVFILGCNAGRHFGDTPSLAQRIACVAGGTGETPDAVFAFTSGALGTKELDRIYRSGRPTGDEFKTEFSNKDKLYYFGDNGDGLKEFNCNEEQ